MAEPRGTSPRPPIFLFLLIAALIGGVVARCFHWD